MALIFASCDVGSPPPDSYRLDRALASWRVEEPCELDSDDSCRWLDDGRLLLELTSENAGNLSITRFWVDFGIPPAGARVELASWTEDILTEARWPRTDIRGRAWVSSNGLVLGQPGGPDLILEAEWTCWISGSTQPGGRRVVVRADVLERALEGRLPLGARHLATSESSMFTDMDASPLSEDGYCRWLEDGRLFVQQVTQAGLNSRVLRLWVDFLPGRPAHVAAASWVATRDHLLHPVWSLGAPRGRAWVNVDGSGVGTVGGPDVIVEVVFRSGGSVDPDLVRGSVLLPEQSLVRAP